MKDKHKNKLYNSRKEWLQVEFNFSEEEIEGLNKFISVRDSGMVSEFLRSVMETEDLNNRQKVIISFIMGRFIQETMEEQMRSIERSMTDNIQSTEFGESGPYGG